tara:strand:+ start:417 stop:1361 length:945 start_codon:yes stop_codon:yes gene_type:complete
MKKIVIIHGEPNSINTEIIVKSWKKLNIFQRKSLFIIGNEKLISAQIKQLKFKVGINMISKKKIKLNSNKINILNVKVKFKNPFKIEKKINSIYIKKCLNLADELARNKLIDGVINCSIDKKIFEKRIGVTEYLSKRNNLNNREVMLIFNKKFSVAPITTHINLNDVQKNISREKIVKKALTISSFFNSKFKKKVKIGVLGLNPHNDEFRKNSFENKIISPAIKLLKKKKLNINGPFSVDEIFLKKKLKFKVIIGMYHDQVLGPFKALFKFNAINITLGLPYIRVSPDHGTASEIIYKKKASPESLINCIKFLL